MVDGLLYNNVLRVKNEIYLHVFFTRTTSYSIVHLALILMEINFAITMDI